MTVTLIDLATQLTTYDDEAECRFCTKTEWGEDNHDPRCPFALAYLAQKEHAASNKSVCPECDSEILPSQFCMMGHFCGEKS